MPTPICFGLGSTLCNKQTGCGFTAHRQLILRGDPLYQHDMEGVQPDSAVRAPTRPLTDRQRERRAGILKATNALLVKHGYDAVSMRAIAQAAGVAERTLFNIYSSKDALVATCARERTEGIIHEAWEKADDPGIGFVLSLCETLSRRTLEQPDVARALAPVLVQHADTVGLQDVYHRYVGRALDELARKDWLEQGDIAMLTRLIGMRMVSAVALWAGRGIADDALETHMRLAICEVLLPHARHDLHAWSQVEARRCVAALAAETA